MDEAAMQAALDRIAAMREARPGPADLEAALARARTQIEALAATTHVMQVGMPGAIQEGLLQTFRPTTRHIAEIRGLMNQVIGRLERLETELLAEKNARVDDLSLLVELISSGWRAANDRLERIEGAVQPQGATVYKLEPPTQAAGWPPPAYVARTSAVPRATSTFAQPTGPRSRSRLMAGPPLLVRAARGRTRCASR